MSEEHEWNPDLDAETLADVRHIKGAIPELAPLSDGAVAALYGHWSEDAYCAGWISISSGLLDDFAEFVRGRPK